MGRSGTTLIDRLLSNHPQIDVLSQPFPLVFIYLKKKYLETLGSKQYYVLNEHLNDNNFSQDTFNKFLENINLEACDLKNLFNEMKNYSGQSTKPDNYKLEFSKNLLGFDKIYKTSLSLFNLNTSKFVGSKEIMCEEFLPYFIKNDFKTMLVYRDPRDVVASINYPKQIKYLGSKKPTLFILRTWKKSIKYLNFLRANKNFCSIKYEDLVNEPYEGLKKVVDFLELVQFENNYFDKAIFNRDGTLWNANTSSNKKISFISASSIGNYKEKLSIDEINYIESVCKKDMIHMGYDFQTEPSIKAISEFRDYDVEDSKDLDKMFSSLEENVNFEVMEFKKNENC